MSHERGAMSPYEGLDKRRPSAEILATGNRVGTKTALSAPGTVALNVNRFEAGEGGEIAALR
jgi:hypothetical protein